MSTIHTGEVLGLELSTIPFDRSYDVAIQAAQLLVESFHELATKSEQTNASSPMDVIDNDAGNEPDRYAFYVARQDGDMVGALLAVKPKWLLRKAYVTRFATNTREKGIGSQLLQYAEDDLFHQGVIGIRGISSRPAEDFYRKRGYRLTWMGKHDPQPARKNFLIHKAKRRLKTARQ